MRLIISGVSCTTGVIVGVIGVIVGVAGVIVGSRTVLGCVALAIRLSGSIGCT